MKPGHTHPKARRRRTMSRERGLVRAVGPCEWSTGSTDPVAVEVERHIPLGPVPESTVAQ